MSKPTVVITLAGSSSRMVPFAQRVNKGALTLLGKPLVVRTVQAFIDKGYTSFVVVVSPTDDPELGVKSVLQSAFPETQIVFAEQTEARGMGNALLIARHHFEGPFIYTAGYHVQAADIAETMIAMPQANVVCSAETKHPWDYGILTIEGELATGLVEKPAKGTEPSNLKIQTVYWLSDAFIELLGESDPQDHYSFETALNQLMTQGKVGHLPLTQCLASLKYPWHLFDLQLELFARLESFRDPTAQISPTAILDETEGPIYIGRGAVIKDFAKIVGPAYIGDESLIGDYTFLRRSSVEAHSQVGAKTEVVRSIIMSHSSLHFGYLADSLIGSSVKIGAGLVTANKRLDRQTLQVRVKGAPVDTGRTELGIMVGEKATLGINLSTMPGVSIGAGAQVYPSLTLYTAVPAGHKLTTTTNTKEV